MTDGQRALLYAVYLALALAGAWVAVAAVLRAYCG